VPAEQAKQAATPPRKRHVPGELVRKVTLGRYRELVHQLVGHPDRRTGGPGQGQRVADADRQMPKVSFHFDSDGHGQDIVVLHGRVVVDDGHPAIKDWARG
jgi:hypothetical protein